MLELHTAIAILAGATLLGAGNVALNLLLDRRALRRAVTLRLERYTAAPVTGSSVR